MNDDNASLEEAKKEDTDSSSKHQSPISSESTPINKSTDEYLSTMMKDVLKASN